MAVNDRVEVRRLGTSIFESADGKEMCIVYRPKVDGQNNLILDSSGGCIFEKVGGVKSGSTGTITGPSLRGERKYFLEYKNESLPSMGVDLVNVYPIQFDAYSGIGWIIGDCLKNI